MPKYRPNRKLAHGVHWDDDRRPILFVTACTQRRAPILANASVHQLFTEVWQEADAWLMGRYVVMPDDLHFFAAPRDEAISLEGWMKYWKSQFGKRRRANRIFTQVRWQRDQWDTRTRSLDSYSEKWEYVRNNPVRKGVVSKAEDWPFQGELNELRWD